MVLWLQGIVLCCVVLRSVFGLSLAFVRLLDTCLGRVYTKP